VPLQPTRGVMILSCSLWLPSRVPSCAVTSMYLSLCKNIKWILMKFTRGDQNRELMKWSHFGRNCNVNKEERYKMKFEFYLSQFCRSGRQLLTPSKWTH